MKHASFILMMRTLKREFLRIGLLMTILANIQAILDERSAQQHEALQKVADAVDKTPIKASIRRVLKKDPLWVRTLGGFWDLMDRVRGRASYVEDEAEEIAWALARQHCNFRIDGVFHEFEISRDYLIDIEDVTDALLRLEDAANPDDVKRVLSFCGK
jgi:hypothetical protein